MIVVIRVLTVSSPPNGASVDCGANVYLADDRHDDHSGGGGGGESSSSSPPPPPPPPDRSQNNNNDKASVDCGANI